MDELIEQFAIEARELVQQASDDLMALEADAGNREHLESAFRAILQQFVKNAVQRKEIIELPTEIFWSVAYGPFYILMKFHLQQSSMAGKAFSLSEQKLKQAFQLVLKALKPS